MRENFIFLEDHRSGPTAVVDSKVNDPFMSCGLGNVVQKSFEFGWGVKPVIVEDCHLGDRHNFPTFLKEHGYSDVFSELEQSVKVANDLVVRTFLIKLFEVTPESLKWFLICH